MEKYEKSVRPAFGMITRWFLDGEPEAAIARKLGVSLTTIRRYRKAYPEFDRLWREGRRQRDDLVEDALFRRAVGGEDPEGKNVPPDVRAAMFWLQNRRPSRWRERRGAAAEPVEIKLTVEEKDL